MRRPAEHGNVVSSIVLGVTAVINGTLLGKNIFSLIYWIPIWTGLFIFDVPVSRLLKDRENLVPIIIIGFSAIIALLKNVWILLPYALFFTAYITRIFLVRKRMNFLSVALGILGYVLLFSLSWLTVGREFVIISITLFLFMLGSEFLVRSVIQKRPYLSLYNLVTVLFVLINPLFLLYTTSLIRIFAGLKIKKIKTIGIIESLLLLITVMLLEMFIVYKIF